MNFSNCCQQFESNKHFFLTDCGPICELALLILLLPPLTYSQCEFFQNNVHLSSPNYKRALSDTGRGTLLPSPSIPTDHGLDWMPLDPVLWVQTWSLLLLLEKCLFREMSILPSILSVFALYLLNVCHELNNFIIFESSCSMKNLLKYIVLHVFCILSWFNIYFV